jgi:hypothetical protein
MTDFLLWAYILNAAIIITHEIDSAYWKEWELFGMPGGPGFFVLIHVPLVSAILFGLVELSKGSETGIIISLLLSLVGIGGFIIHSYFLRKGRKEFSTPASLAILFGMLVFSVVQAFLTVERMALLQQMI